MLCINGLFCVETTLLVEHIFFFIMLLLLLVMFILFSSLLLDVDFLGTSYYQIGDAFVCEKIGLVHGMIFLFGILLSFISIFFIDR